MYSGEYEASLSKHLGMLLELRKARKISRAFLNSRNIPACLDQAIQTR